MGLCLSLVFLLLLFKGRRYDATPEDLQDLGTYAVFYG